MGKSTSSSPTTGALPSSQDDYYKKLSADQAAAKTSATNSMYGQLASSAMNIGEGVYTTVGGKMADKDNISGGVDMVSQGLISSGNPYAMAAGVAIKGLDTLDRGLGKGVKGVKDTTGLGGYADLSTQDKQYRWTQGKGANTAQRSASEANMMVGLKQGIKTQQDKINNALPNFSNQLAIKNSNNLKGGVNTNSLMGKNGIKLHFTNLKNKVNHKIELAKKAIEPYTVLEEPEITLFEEGGKFNLLPEGALHARKNNMDMNDITDKGIPVVSFDEGGEITQHAEIENSEIIFHKEVTDKLEDFWKKHKEGDETAAIEAGKLLMHEILENTQDNVGLLQPDVV